MRSYIDRGFWFNIWDNFEADDCQKHECKPS